MCVLLVCCVWVCACVRVRVCRSLALSLSKQTSNSRTPTCKHNSILNVAKRQIDDFVEEKGSSGGAGEAGGDEFAPVGQIGVATDAREQPTPTHMVEEYAPHSDG